MATVIVNSSVWSRVHKYYDNVETKYPNTWDINDTIEQIEKIQWVICNFENVCIWSREPIIPSWKRNGWKETWHKISPWHFAFEYKLHHKVIPMLQLRNMGIFISGLHLIVYHCFLNI